MAAGPAAVLVIGNAGCGKSTLARSLAGRLGAAYLDKDALANGFTGALLTAHGGHPDDRDGSQLYAATVRPLEYAALWAVAADNLRLGTSVVLDAPFGAFLDQEDYIAEILAGHGLVGARVVVVQARADEQTNRDRLSARGLARDRWKLQHWQEYWAGVAGVRCSWRGVELVQVDLSGDEQVGRLVTQVRGG